MKLAAFFGDFCFVHLFKIKFGYNNSVKSFLFVGPTGVGKTNLATLFASCLVGSFNFLRLDMSEFSDSTSVNKIIGS